MLADCALHSAIRLLIGDIYSVKTVEATANELIRCEITGRVLGVTYTQKKSDGSTATVNVGRAFSNSCS